MELASKLFIFAALITCSYAANDTGLTTLNDYDCGCPGQNASYICTAVGGLITVWAGTAFNCAGRDEISLRHSQFASAIGQCNNGAIVGYSIENVDNCFTSRLDVRLSADLHGRTITCSLDDGIRGVTIIGTRTLIVTTPSAPPPSSDSDSERISILLANPRELIFSWDQVEYDCPMLEYNFTSENCGSCAEVTPRVVSCTEFHTSSAGITCTFTVWSIVCGNITDPGSMQSANINLKVPDAPTIESLPRYLDGRTRILTRLMTTFPTVVSPYIFNGVDGSVNNYTISYISSTFHTSCGTVNIPASSCVDGMCTHNFDVLNDSSCPPTTTIIVSVVASNVLGSSPSSTQLIREGLNNLVNVNFDPNQRIINCTFLNQPLNIMKQCSAKITYGANCDRFLNTFSGMGTGDVVATQPLEAVPGVVEYCFVVTAESNNETVLVDGSLTLQLQNTIIDSPQTFNLIAAIIAPIVLVFLVLIQAVIVVAVMVKYFRSTITVQIIFSVEDKPGSLAKALKVFKDCNVNILGLNAHLYHTDFDRDAGKGYKFHYIHCICTKDDKEFLKKKLNAEFKGDADDQQNQTTCENDSEVHTRAVTAIIKVKDSQGELWRVIHTIGDRGINITGVNTLSDRESIPGYKDNYVKCYCSRGSLRKLQSNLEAVTGKEVNVKFLDEDLKERAIQYSVKDRIGALASTLQVFSDMGINISGVNLDHLPEDINWTTRGGLKINFIECSIDRSTKETLFNKLMREYGAVNAELHTDNLDASGDSSYSVVKVTVHNETGSLNRILKAFRDLKININDVNILDPALKSSNERETQYNHYHLEITATNDQEMNLKKRLLARGLAIDVDRFNLAKFQQADHANHNKVQNIMLQSDYGSEENDSIADSDDPPTTKRIQFYVRNEVGALSNALQVFSELGISITKVNPAHLSRKYEVEFVECSCADSQRESLIDNLKSYGALKAKLLPEVQNKMITDPNYCVVKFSVPEVGSIVEILKAFPDTGAKIFKVNPTHIKVYNQYVECCCEKDERKELLTRLEKIRGVTHVTLEPESNVSVKPTEDLNYCIIKYSVGDKAGTLVRALKVFSDSNINIIGVNTLNLAFDRTVPVKYKHNHVVFEATDDQEEELKQKLLVTGLAIDVKPYERVQRSDNSKSLQPGNMGRNDIALTGIEVQND